MIHKLQNIRINRILTEGSDPWNGTHSKLWNWVKFHPITKADEQTTPGQKSTISFLHSNFFSFANY